MDKASRRAVARVAAPAAFLLAATIAVLLVRAGLRGAEEPLAPGTTVVATTSQAPGGRFYVVARGDTLASIARRHGTTVGRLRRLNRGLDPVSLPVGARIRVR